MQPFTYSKREMYAKLFVSYFMKDFLKIIDDSDVDQFTITRKQFAEFLLNNNFLPRKWKELPEVDDSDKWRNMLYHCNKIRAEMNNASRLGLHGEPPFEAKANRVTGDITVRNLQRMAMVTYSEVGNAIETYLNNKFKDQATRHHYYMQPEILSQLPAVLQGRIGSAEGYLRMAISNATHGLHQYLEEANDMLEKAEKYIKEDHQLTSD